MFLKNRRTAGIQAKTQAHLLPKLAVLVRRVHVNQRDLVLQQLPLACEAHAIALLQWWEMLRVSRDEDDEEEKKKKDEKKGVEEWTKTSVRFGVLNSMSALWYPGGNDLRNILDYNFG